MNARPLSIIPALCDHEDCHSRDISWIEYLGGAFCPVHADPTASYEDDTVKAPRAERRRQIHTSHDACDHPKTKAGRQACRRARARGANITSEELRDMAEKSRQETAVEYRHALGRSCNGHRTDGYAFVGGELVCRKCGEGQENH